MKRGRYFMFGLGVLAAAWLGPLPALAARSFVAHMTMHMAVVALAAPLLAISIAGGRFDPVCRARGLFSTGTFLPMPASFIEMFVVWAWHAPALHHLARQSGALLALEQASFLAAGLLVWLAAFGGSPAQRRQRIVAGVAALLLTSMHMTLLGVLLALAERNLYAHDGTPAFGLTPLQDQQLGGVTMLFAGGSAYLIGALWLTFALLKEKRDAVSPG